jgi:hypothetical protein
MSKEAEVTEKYFALNSFTTDDVGRTLNYFFCALNAPEYFVCPQRTRTH